MGEGGEKGENPSDADAEVVNCTRRGNIHVMATPISRHRRGSGARRQLGALLPSRLMEGNELDEDELEQVRYEVV
jgi:hypothetical protein